MLEKFKMLESIKVKFVLIAAVAVIAVSALAANSWWANRQVEAAIQVSEIKLEALENIVAMEKANLTMVLMAMDSIVDKDEGRVDPERAETIAENVNILKTSGARLFELAVTREDRETINAIIANIDPLAKGIQVDLVALIESNAPQSAFTAIDDVIDEFGEGMSNAMVDYEKQLEALLHKANYSLERSVNTAQIANSTVFFVSIILLSAILLVFGRMIVGQITSMSGAMRELADGNNETEVPFLN